MDTGEKQEIVEEKEEKMPQESTKENIPDIENGQPLLSSLVTEGSLAATLMDSKNGLDTNIHQTDLKSETKDEEEVADEICDTTESEFLCDETEGTFSEDNIEDYGYEADMPSLRPKDVPKAPRNFTQFIMDEHDDCDMFIDFNKMNELPRDYSVSSSVRDQEFFDQDFQNVYQNERESRALQLPRETLIERILEMREKVKVLQDQLTEREEHDPRTVLTKLHATLVALQEENKNLRNRLGPCKIHQKL
ncbi:uncharacterized protein LOC136033298 [Artemia franciscana]|uniref:Uncharacterized protein n=1 Tax=Artemia franciscana TaxID=6661 RepID=A0AA88IM98_ARTSF|nr:hypothetical protein QYM36_001015 [Artemia franciscana]